MPEVRQSSFALLGDLTKACFQHVQPHVGMLSVSVFRVCQSSSYFCQFNKDWVQHGTNYITVYLIVEMFCMLTATKEICCLVLYLTFVRSLKFIGCLQNSDVTRKNCSENFIFFQKISIVFFRKISSIFP